MADHGTLTMGINHGCDCDDCKAAVSAYRAEYRATNPRSDGPGPNIRLSGQAWRETEPIRLVDATDPRWGDEAACKGADPNLWFPIRGETAKPAKDICATCPVRQACGDYATATRQQYGIWGGQSPAERGVRQSGTRRKAA